MVQAEESIGAYYDRYTAVYLRHALLFQIGRVSANDGECAEYLARAMAVKNGERILDCGCGIGFMIHYLSSKFPGVRACGVTISKVGARIGNRGGIIAGDFQELPFDDGSFDLVFFHESLGYGDRSKSLREATRVLDDGGRIHIKDLCVAQGDPVKVARLSESWMYRYDRSEDIEQECEAMNLRKEFSRLFPSNFNEATLAIMTDPDLLKRHPPVPGIAFPFRAWEFCYAKR